MILRIIFITTVEIVSHNYILNSQGQAAEYTKQLNAGEAATLTVGVINHEHRTTEYRVEISLEGNTIGQLDAFQLEDGQTSEQQVTFVIDETGDGQKLQFLLFKDGDSASYRELHLFVDVS